jgi:hypothetical protein
MKKKRRESYNTSFGRTGAEPREIGRKMNLSAEGRTGKV